jgi:hypothetical protein
VRVVAAALETDAGSKTLVVVTCGESGWSRTGPRPSAPQVFPEVTANEGRERSVEQRRRGALQKFAEIHILPPVAGARERDASGTKGKGGRLATFLRLRDRVAESNQSNCSANT